MTDVLTKKQRSFNMSRIRGTNTAPEKVVRAGLRAAGVRGFRVNYPILGKPDIAFPVSRLAVFVDGCFWLRCRVDYQPPQTRKRFWASKISRNLARDRRVERALQDDGWAVLRVWEHEVKDDPEGVVALIRRRLEAARASS